MGSYVVRDLLSERKEVVCFQRGGITPTLRSVVGENKINDIKIVQGDISNTILVFNTIKENNIDTIIHLSCITVADAGMSESQPAYALQVNCVGMNNLLEAVKFFGLRKIVWTSSIQSLGNIVEYYKEPVHDDAIYKSDTMYGATKMLNEFMSKLYSDQLGVDSLGFRIGFIMNFERPMGPNGDFTEFMKNMATDKPAVMMTKDADQVRPLGYIENISALLVEASKFPPTQTKVFNAIEYFVSCRQLVECALKVNPRAKVTIKDHVSDAEAIWWGAQEPQIDSSGIRKELGWQPKYTLDEAMRRFLNKFRMQEGLPLL